MSNTFNFVIPTFDNEDSNEIILDVPFSNIGDSQITKPTTSDFSFATVNEMTDMIVAKMINSVRQDLSSVQPK